MAVLVWKAWQRSLNPRKSEFINRTCLAVRSVSSDNNPSDSLSPFLNIPVISNQAKYLVHCLEQCLISFFLPLGLPRKQSWLSSSMPFRTLWHCRQRDSSQEREVQITWMAFLDKQNHYNVKLVYLCLLWWVYVYVLVPWWQLSSSSSRTRFADCCDYGYLPHLILSLSIFLHPSMWSAFQSLIGYPLMPLTPHFLQGPSFALPVQAFRPISHFLSDKWPFMCDPRMCHFHSQHHATRLNLASTI